MKTMLSGKIHRATLTGANVDYDGIIAIDSDLLDLAGILEFEQVHVWNVTNGERLETYAIPAPAGSGEICLNGAAAHKGRIGDIVIIAAFAVMEERAAVSLSPKVVYVDPCNRPVPGMCVSKVA